MTRPAETIGLVAVDGRDALAYVIVRPGPNDRGVVVDAAAHGMTKKSAAFVLRQVADQFDAENADQAHREG